MGQFIIKGVYGLNIYTNLINQKTSALTVIFCVTVGRERQKFMGFVTVRLKHTARLFMYGLSVVIVLKSTCIQKSVKFHQWKALVFHVWNFQPAFYCQKQLFQLLMLLKQRHRLKTCFVGRITKQLCGGSNSQINSEMFRSKTGQRSYAITFHWFQAFTNCVHGYDCVRNVYVNGVTRARKFMVLIPLCKNKLNLPIYHTDLYV